MSSPACAVVCSANDAALVAAAFIAAAAKNPKDCDANAAELKIVLCGEGSASALGAMGARLELSPEQATSVFASCAVVYAADEKSALSYYTKKEETLVMIGDERTLTSSSSSSPFTQIVSRGNGVQLVDPDGKITRVVSLSDAEATDEAEVEGGKKKDEKANLVELRLLLDNKLSENEDSSALRAAVLLRATALFIALNVAASPAKAAEASEKALRSGAAGHLADRFVALSVRFSVAGSSGKEDILSVIARQRRRDVAAARAQCSLEELMEKLAGAPPAIDFVARLQRCQPTAVMAEVKRASPSKGDIAPGIDAAAQALKYAQGGAAAISVLTEPTWFKGTLEDMRRAREAVGAALGADRPAILRKDFLLEEYQVRKTGFGKCAPRCSWFVLSPHPRVPPCYLTPDCRGTRAWRRHGSLDCGHFVRRGAYEPVGGVAQAGHGAAGGGGQRA